MALAPSSRAENPARRQRASAREKAAVAAILLIGAALRLAGPDLAYFSYHAARDLYRTAELIWGGKMPLLGSELQYGGRSLGPALYFVAAPALLLWKSPIAVSLWIGLLDVGAMLLLWSAARRFWGAAVALTSLAFYAFFPLSILQLRFLWNPSFLPVFLFLALAGLSQIVCRRRPWHLLTVVVALGVAFQIHFSAIHTGVACALLLLGARAPIAKRHLAVAAVAAALLFAPALAAEFSGETKNVAAIARGDWFSRAGPRWRYNPNALRVYLYELMPRSDEDSRLMGFTYLESFARDGVNWYRPRTYLLLMAIEQAGRVQFVFWLLGVGVCVAGSVDPRIARRWTATATPTPTAADANSTGEEAETPLGRAPYAIVLIWQALPVATLSFFDFHHMPANLGAHVPGYIPLRYFVAAYPMPFVCAAIGVVFAARLVGRGASATTAQPGSGPGRAWAAGVVYAAVAALLAGYVLYDVKVLQYWKRSGRSVVYSFPNVVPSLRTMIEVRDILLGDAAIDVTAFYERVHHQQFAQNSLGEAGLDWLVTQDARSWKNPPPDPHLRWLIHSPFVLRHSVISPAPGLPAGAREVRRWPVGPVGDMSVIEYRLGDASAPLPLLPPHVEMRNFYHQFDTWPYLGPDPEATARARRPLPEYPLPPLPPEGRIDIGTAADEPYMVYGWSLSTTERGRSIRWMRRQAIVRFSLGVPAPGGHAPVGGRVQVWAKRVDAEAETATAPARRHLEVRVDDRLVESVALDPEVWTEVRLPIPAGEANVEIMFSSTEAPPAADSDYCFAFDDLVVE